MSRQFLIAGLPRCRTAWLSVASTSARSICYHEPSANVSSFEQLEALWQPKFGQSIGISDSAMTMQLERITETIKPRILLVERPLPELLTSFRKYLADSPIEFDYEVGGDYLMGLQAEIDRFRTHPLAKIVKFSALDDYETVRDMLAWLVPGADFPDLASLMRMNIQVKREYLFEQMTRPHNRWDLERWNTSRKSATG